jgi:hypothetical protein
MNGTVEQDFKNPVKPSNGDLHVFILTLENYLSHFSL